MDNDFIILIFEAIFYGFCFTSLISYFISLSKSKNIKLLNKNFFNQSIKCIRIVGIIYIIYTVGYYFYYLNFIMSEDDYLSTKNRATGPYAWAYWVMLLRPLVFALLTQFFWIRKIQRKSFLNFILTFIIFIVILFSGVFIERFIIIITSFHRDYLPSNWVSYRIDRFWYIIPLLLIAFFTVRVVIYFFLVITMTLISKKVFKPKL